jgi:stalled ribosome alternative rescue factor ArfA
LINGSVSRARTPEALQSDVERELERAKKEVNRKGKG